VEQTQKHYPASCHRPSMTGVAVVVTVPSQRDPARRGAAHPAVLSPAGALCYWRSSRARAHSAFRQSILVLVISDNSPALVSHKQTLMLRADAGPGSGFASAVISCLEGIAMLNTSPSSSGSRRVTGQ